MADMLLQKKFQNEKWSRDAVLWQQSATTGRSGSGHACSSCLALATHAQTQKPQAFNLKTWLTLCQLADWSFAAACMMITQYVTSFAALLAGTSAVLQQ
jgi:hypothetical protein